MPNEIENAFAALSDDAGRARFAGAADIRRRADRRVLKRSVTGAALAVVLAGGAVISSRAILADNRHTPPPLPPVHSASPSLSP